MIYPLQILKDVVSTYEGEFSELRFFQGLPSGLNKVEGVTPFVWVMESDSSITSERLQQGLYRVRVRFLILRTTADRSSGKPQSSPQANDADRTLAVAEMEQIGSQLAYYLQYRTPIIGYSQFSWQMVPVHMQASGLYTGVLVTASMVMRDAECATMFAYPPPTFFTDENGLILTDENGNQFLS